MEYKSYNQMRQEFVDFYHKEVKVKLPEYLKMRRLEGPMQLAFWGAFCSFSLVFAFLIWYEFVSKLIFAIFPNLVFLNSIVKVLLVIDIVIVVISIISLLILSSFESKNRVGNTRYIQQDLEMALKQDLMPKFVSIFLEKANWYKKSLYNYQNYAGEQNSDKKYHLKDLRSLKILNPYPRENYDDIILGSFRDVHINIYEMNTQVLKFPEVVVICFLFIWLCGFTGGLFFYIFLFLILPPILLTLLLLSFKIIQYSKFKGVVVEFDMNKNFHGHTIIHEKSITAKKIPIPKGYEEVKLEKSDFSDRYNVYSDNQIEARYLLTPSMMERIENLKFTFKALYIRCAFKNNKLTIAIHTGKDMFAMGNDFKDSDSNTFQILYDEMVSILKIVDELKLNQHLGL